MQQRTIELVKSPAKMEHQMDWRVESVYSRSVTIQCNNKKKVFGLGVWLRLVPPHSVSRQQRSWPHVGFALSILRVWFMIQDFSLVSTWVACASSLPGLSVLCWPTPFLLVLPCFGCLPLLLLCLVGVVSYRTLCRVLMLSCLSFVVSCSITFVCAVFSLDLSLYLGDWGG